ncbi:hypothetical protein [Thiofilum flexile]|uniref:hypothetical protein n=1 Tax=Thiofilum flexile TaxID=125627 RepID=UPI00037A8B2E|nr:hypothetical protein [Thiofilum flexile]
MTASAPKSTHSTELFAHGLKLELDREAEGLDMATQSRLTQIRHQVLTAENKHNLRYWGWFSGLVVAGIASLVLSQSIQLYAPPAPAISTPPSRVAVVSKLPAELDVSSIEFMLAYEDELDIVEYWDLYTWLVAEHS